MLFMHIFMYILFRQTKFEGGRREVYPIPLETVLVTEIRVEDVELQTFGTLEGTRRFATAGTFSGGWFFCCFGLGFSYRGHRLVCRGLSNFSVCHETLDLKKLGIQSNPGILTR